MAEPKDTDEHPNEPVEGQDPAFEEVVAAALKVDPKGLSRKLGGTSESEEAPGADQR